MTSKLDPGQIVKEIYNDSTGAIENLYIKQDTIPWLTKGMPINMTIGDLAQNKWDYVAYDSDTSSLEVTVSGASATVNGTFTIKYTDANKTDISLITFA